MEAVPDAPAQRHRQVLVRGDQVAPAQRHETEQQIDGTATALGRPRRLHGSGRGEHLGRLVQRAPPPEQLGEPVDGRQRLGEHAVVLRVPDDGPADPLRLGVLADVAQVCRVPGPDPRHEPRLAVPLGGRVGRVREPQRLGMLAVDAGVQHVDVVRGGELVVGDPLAGRAAALVQPEQPHPALAGQAPFPPPLVQPDRDAQALPGAAGGARPPQRRPYLVGQRVEPVQRQRDRPPVGAPVGALDGVQCPVGVAVPRGTLLAGLDQAPRGIPADRVEHPVRGTRRRHLGLYQRLVHQDGQRAERVLV